MKFKYNYLENKLWKLDGEYSYEVTENNRFQVSKGNFGSDGWLLGNQTRIIFTVDQARWQVYYQIGIVAYQKVLKIPPNGEITFEFTDQDLISHAKI